MNTLRTLYARRKTRNVATVDQIFATFRCITVNIFLQRTRSYRVLCASMDFLWTDLVDTVLGRIAISIFYIQDVQILLVATRIPYANEMISALLLSIKIKTVWIRRTTNFFLIIRIFLTLFYEAFFAQRKNPITIFWQYVCFVWRFAHFTVVFLY